MKIPEAIAQKAQQSHDARELADKLFEEVEAWLNENTGTTL